MLIPTRLLKHRKKDLYGTRDRLDQVFRSKNREQKNKTETNIIVKTRDHLSFRTESKNVRIRWLRGSYCSTSVSHLESLVQTEGQSPSASLVLGRCLVWF